MSDGEFLVGFSAPAGRLRFDLAELVSELTRENTRLHRLVAELMMKNEELRRQTVQAG